MTNIGKLKKVEQGSVQIASVTSGAVSPMRVEVATIEWHGSDYSGPYEVVPTAEAQVLSTHGKNMTHDFIIDPIPSNYGLITWNGSFLTVS